VPSESSFSPTTRNFSPLLVSIPSSLATLCFHSSSTPLVRNEAPPFIPPLTFILLPPTLFNTGTVCILPSISDMAFPHDNTGSRWLPILNAVPARVQRFGYSVSYHSASLSAPRLIHRSSRLLHVCTGNLGNVSHPSSSGWHHSLKCPQSWQCMSYPNISCRLA
jgi:hypothetical protein